MARDLALAANFDLIDHSLLCKQAETQTVLHGQSCIRMTQSFSRFFNNLLVT
jgi:hypothetical protein